MKGWEMGHTIYIWYGQDVSLPILLIIAKFFAHPQNSPWHDMNKRSGGIMRVLKKFKFVTTIWLYHLIPFPDYIQLNYSTFLTSFSIFPCLDPHGLLARSDAGHTQGGASTGVHVSFLHWRQARHHQVRREAHPRGHHRQHPQEDGGGIRNEAAVRGVHHQDRRQDHWMVHRDFSKWLYP